MLIRIIESNLEELLDLMGTLPPMSLERSYAAVLRNYLSGDLSALEKQISYPWPDPVSVIVSLRFQIRARVFDPKTIESAEAQFPQTTDPLWRGELSFVLARAYEIQDNHHKGSEWYQISSDEFSKAGALRKSVKAYQNYLAEENRAHPNRRLIPEFRHIFKKASALGEYGVAGVALLNVSQEYERVGAFRPALKYANRAILFLERDEGSLHFELALVHRSLVLFRIGRDEEALADLEQAKISNHKEVKAALSVVEALYQDGDSPQDLAALTTGWKNRWAQRSSQASLGELEGKFVAYISEKPRDRFEVIEYLYGKNTELEALENRFKNLIARVRKKVPDLVICEKGKYQISDVRLLPHNILKKRRAG